MITASQKRKENIAEYLLYMWQVEDIIRANGLDLDAIRRNVISRYDIAEEQRRQLEEWYESLIDMMRREGVERAGHLQLNRNVLAQLAELHNALLADARFADYSKLFYAALPAIVELRSKAGATPAGEIETCFNALYGMLMLRLQGRQVSDDTARAIGSISRLIAALARNFHLDEHDRLFQTEEN